MITYKIIFDIRRAYRVAIFVEAENETALDEFVREFYPDTNWNYVEMKNDN